MIERLAAAAALLVLFWAAGALLRGWTRRRATVAAETLLLANSTSGQPQIVTFYGPRCTACDRQKAILEQLLGHDSRAASVRFVDAVAEANLAQQFGVFTIPTTIVASSNGRIVSITAGLVTPAALSEQLAQAA